MSAVVELNDRMSSADSIAADLVRRGRVAQEIFANADQARVDEAVRAIAWSLYQPEHAKELAELAVEGDVVDRRLLAARRLECQRGQRHHVELATERLRKALADVYDDRDTLSVARRLAEKQAPRLRKLDPQVARRRLVGMLQRRGFDYEDIQPVIEHVLGNRDERA